MKEFLNFVVKLVTEWSKDRDSSFMTTKKFITKPEIQVSQWTHAFQWCKKDKRIVKLTRNNQTIFMFTSTDVSYQATKTMCKGHPEVFYCCTVRFQYDSIGKS